MNAHFYYILTKAHEVKHMTVVIITSSITIIIITVARDFVNHVVD